jgi:mannose-6-phosphate isomerase-like protein (cupin superfamily)
MIKSKENSPSYSWGDKCTGWHLVKNDSLGVIQESMPPNTSEVNHKHAKAQQFFFILKGTATFLIDGKSIEVPSGSGIHIEKDTWHQIQNLSKEEIEFLVISEPHSHGDRVLE